MFKSFNANPTSFIETIGKERHSLEHIPKEDSGQYLNHDRLGSAEW